MSANDPVRIVSDESDYYSKVALGEIPSIYNVSKFGDNGDVDTATDPEDCWSYGGVYTFSTTAAIDTMSSSNIADTTQLIGIWGQTIDGLEVYQEIQSNGQTQVALLTPLWRVYRLKNLGSVDLQGTLYIYENVAAPGGIPSNPALIRAEIPIDAFTFSTGQTEMAVYTVPSNYIALMSLWYISMSRSADSLAVCTLRERAPNGVFQVKQRLSLNSGATSYIDREWKSPRRIEPGTDIVVRCDLVSANNTGISSGFDLELHRI